MDSRTDVLLFSEVSHEDYGPTPAATQTGIRAISHSSGCVPRVLRGTPNEIVMKIPRSFEISTHLYFYAARAELCLCDDYVFFNRIGNRVRFRVRCPQAGYYTLKIYVGSHGSASPWPNVFNYVIEALEPDKTAAAFPVPVECYENGDFELVSPLSRFLPPHQKVFFSLMVSAARNVVIVNGNRKTCLVSECFDHTWTGELVTSESGIELQVIAEFAEEFKRQPTLLLLYKIVDPEAEADRKERTVRYVNSESESEVDDNSVKLMMGDHNKILTEDAESFNPKLDLVRVKEELIRLLNHESEEEYRMVISQKVNKIRKELSLKMKSRNLKELESYVASVQQQSFAEELESEILAAEKVIKSLSHLEEHRSISFRLEASAVSEIRRYTVPPQTVHDIMMSALLLLGHDEGQTRKWSYCQKLCGTLGLQGLRKKLQEFDVLGIHPDILERAWNIVKHVRISSVAQTCPAVLTFYTWVADVYKEYNQFYRSLRSQNRGANGL